MVVACTALLPICGYAQSSSPRNEDELIRRVTFEGVEGLREGQLRNHMATQPTRCRGLLLQPICWLTDWGLVVHREYLDEEEVRRDELRLEVHYFRQGFRQARARSEILERPDGYEIVFRVDEGDPTIIETREVEWPRDVISERHVRRAEIPVEGNRLDLDRLESSLEHLQERLGELGYLDAVVRDSIYVSGHRAALRVVIEPGPQSVAGEVVVHGNEQVEADVIREGLRVQQGDVLRSHHLTASQHALYESNLFYQAQISVPEQADSVKTVVVDVREAPPRRAEIGGGFSTTEFFQADAQFTHYNWLGGGRRLSFRATAANLLAGQLSGQGIFVDVRPSGASVVDETAFLRPTWALSAEFRQPGFVAATDRFAASAFADRQLVPGIVVEHSYGASASYTRRLTYRTPLSLTYRYERTSVAAGDLYFCVNHGVCDPATIEAVRGWNALSPAVLSFQSDQSDDALAPSRGYRIRADLEHASSLTLSDYRYNRASGSARYYLPFDARGARVLGGRVRFGWVGPLASTAEAIGVDVFDERVLHPRKRFYAGGSRSVRGYWENQLGPRVLTISPSALEAAGCSPAEIAGGTCDPTAAPADLFTPRPTGGTTVIEGSVEYRFPLFGPVRGAVFVDGGIVGERLGALFTEGVGAVTPGIGARYVSPIGPIRVDIGFRPATVETLPVVTEYIDEDGLRRIVRLETPYDYDPIEAAGGNGFFRQAIARLRLHLSIGEAL